MRITKNRLFELLDHQPAKAAIKVIGEDEIVCIGRLGNMAILDNGVLDVWAYKPSDLVNGLHARKIFEMHKRLKEFLPSETKIHLLDGELWFQLIDYKPHIENIMRVLRIRKYYPGNPNSAINLQPTKK